MFTVIYQKELLNQIRSQKLTVSLLVVLLLTVWSVTLALNHFESKMDEYSKVIAKQQSILRETESMTVESLGDGGFETVDKLIVRKPGILSVFAGEKDRTLGDIVPIGSKEYHLYAQTYNSLNDIIKIRLRDFMTDLSRNFDFSDIITVLFSLMAILIGFDIISSEKTEGTLRLIHSNSISRGTFLCAKWAASFTVLMFAVLFAFVMVLLSVPLLSNYTFTRGEIIRIALFGMTSLLYLSFFYNLSVLTSTFVRESKNSILIMLIVWIGVVFVIPNTVHIAAEHVCIDTPMDYLITKRIEIHKRDQEVTNRLIKEQNNAEMRRVLAQHKKELNAIKQKQYENHIVQRNSVLSSMMISPAVLYKELSERVLGTSVNDYMAFMDRTRKIESIHSDMVADYSSRRDRTFEYRKSFNVDLNGTFIRASSDSNRLSLGGSLHSATWLLLMFLIADIIISAVNLYMYNNAKTLV